MKYLKLFEQYEDDPFGEELGFGEDYNDIRVGDRVVCINDAGTKARLYLNKGEHYTIKSIGLNLTNLIELNGLDGKYWLKSRFEKLRHYQ